MGSTRMSATVKAAIITVVGAILVALIALLQRNSPTFVLPGIGAGAVTIASARELDAVITDRWRRIDNFLAVVASTPSVGPDDKKIVGGLRDSVRALHTRHSVALNAGNLVLAHERLRDLRRSSSTLTIVGVPGMLAALA